jgi:hypothetical protein
VDQAGAFGGARASAIGRRDVGAGALGPTVGLAASLIAQGVMIPDILHQLHG